MAALPAWSKDRRPSRADQHWEGWGRSTARLRARSPSAPGPRACSRASLAAGRFALGRHAPSRPRPFSGLPVATNTSELHGPEPRFPQCGPPASALRRGPHLLPSWPLRPCAPSPAPSPGFRPRGLRPSRTTGDALRPPTRVPAARRPACAAQASRLLETTCCANGTDNGQRPAHSAAARRDPEQGKQLRRKSAKPVGPGVTWFKGSWASRGHGFHSLARPTIEGPGTPTSTVFPVLRARVAAGGRLTSWSTARRPSPLSASWPAFTSWP